MVALSSQQVLWNICRFINFLPALAFYGKSTLCHFDLFSYLYIIRQASCLWNNHSVHFSRLSRLILHVPAPPLPPTTSSYHPWIHSVPFLSLCFCQLRFVSQSDLLLFRLLFWGVCLIWTDYHRFWVRPRFLNQSRPLAASTTATANPSVESNVQVRLERSNFWRT